MCIAGLNSHSGYATAQERIFIYLRSMYFYGHFIMLIGFASPWISSWLGMETTQSRNLTETEEVADKNKNVVINHGKVD